ncbi:hypothetical protein [Trinickia dabaoshanensis]|uniref:hypothetical protein n=1 Tax=Trinickia dabaoshanensis TaxID=564714 RepID=UPI001304A4E4|nr:hypothetical protein [Trinickia dabaoshanensis]
MRWDSFVLVPSFGCESMRSAVRQFGDFASLGNEKKSIENKRALKRRIFSIG